jgi:hypothetical protein
MKTGASLETLLIEPNKKRSAIESPIINNFLVPKLLTMFRSTSWD